MQSVPDAPVGAGREIHRRFPPIETLTYDLDGNLLTDSRWTVDSAAGPCGCGLRPAGEAVWSQSSLAFRLLGCG